MTWPIHGSNPHYVYKALTIPMPDKVNDFSVNLNPFGPPTSIKLNWNSWFNYIEDYPDPSGSELIKLLAKKEQIQENTILLGNGAAELITLVANMLSGKHVLIMQPTFAEYERMCRAYGCEISYLTLKEGSWALDFESLVSRLESVDALFLCHPNNPTGVAYPENILLKIIDACRMHNCLLIVDEAFYDFLDGKPTMVPFITENEYLIVLRSMTKMYAIAGLRLGYIIAEQKIIEKLQSYQPHWSVNTLALLAGKECFSEQAYVKETCAFINSERERMMKVLQSVGYVISESKVNFYLLRDPVLDQQLPLFTFLLHKGLVPRHTANYPGLNGRWLRFAVKQIQENDLLLEALLAWKKKD